MDGSWKSGDTWYGFKQKMVELAPFAKTVPEDAAKLANDAFTAISEGKLHPFTGPIKSRMGRSGSRPVRRQPTRISRR